MSGIADNSGPVDQGMNRRVEIEVSVNRSSLTHQKIKQMNAGVDVQQSLSQPHKENV